MTTGTKTHNTAFDTNILISAILFGGKPRLALELAISREVQLVTSPPLLAELAGVLRDKFTFSNTEVKAVHKAVRLIARIVEPTQPVTVLADEADNRVLEAALVGNCHCIITGDKGLLALKRWEDVLILPADHWLKHLK